MRLTATGSSQLEVRMRLTMQQRQAVVAKTAARYQRSRKKEKSMILSELVELTEYSRAYARRVLRQHGQRVKPGKQALVVDVRLRAPRQRSAFYDDKVKAALLKIWRMMDYICGKRMQPALAEMVVVLERHNELRCDPGTRAKLLRISAATIDRLLRTERRKYELRGKARTKPGTLLKHQIPIRTFAEWNEQQPGFAEIDLVGHDGGVAAGDYCQTLDLTDIATTWTETMAVRNKAQARVFEALQKCAKTCLFHCWDWIVITVQSSLMMNCYVTVSSNRSASLVLVLIARMIVALSSRRTIRSCAARLVMRAMTRMDNVNC